MKKQTKSTSMLIHIWEDYEFSLYIPKDLSGFNKPHVSFYYQNREAYTGFLKVRSKKQLDLQYPIPYLFKRLTSCSILSISPTKQIE